MSDLVLDKVPGSQVATDVGAELSFILPSSATHHFPPLFDTLEGDQSRTLCNNLGITMQFGGLSFSYCRCMYMYTIDKEYNNSVIIMVPPTGIHEQPHYA